MLSPLFKRLARAVSLTVFLAYALSFGVGADDLDTDGDGMNDEDEIAYGFDPNNSDENLNEVLDGLDDADGDGITNQDEIYTLGTSPILADTDGDGVNDGDEITAGTDPLVDERPDLFVTGLAMSSSTQFGFTVANQGLTDVVETDGLTTVTVDGLTIYSYLWSTLSDQNFLLAGGSTDYGLYGLGNGTHTVTVCVDSTGLVSETDRSNNCATSVFTVTESESSLMVEAGPDQYVLYGSTFSLVAAYAEGYEASPLYTATIAWGDGTVDTATQTELDGRIYLQGSHDFPAPETYIVRVCAAQDSADFTCDTFKLSVLGGSSSASTGNSAGGDSSTEEDTNVDLSGEEDSEIYVDTEIDQEVELSSEDCSAMAFDDVSEADGFYDAVCSLWANDVIHGRDANTFDGDDWIRRDEASKVFTRLFDYVTEAYGDTPEAEGMFVDVDQDDSLAYYTEVAAEEGIMDYDVDSVKNDEGDIVDEAYFMPHDAMTVLEIKEALQVADGNDYGSDLEAEGYAAEDKMTRGSFVQFLFGLFQ
jgi:hypothetical protein